MFKARLIPGVPDQGEKGFHDSGQNGSMDQLTCIDFEGKQLWQVDYRKSWDQSYCNLSCIAFIKSKLLPKRNHWIPTNTTWQCMFMLY